jgi:release factor glutamine methyltransferase
LTILQVNVRPAGKFRKSANSQGSERAERTLVNPKNHYQLIPTPADRYTIYHTLPPQGREQPMIGEHAHTRDAQQAIDLDRTASHSATHHSITQNLVRPHPAEAPPATVELVDSHATPIAPAHTLAVPTTAAQSLVAPVINEPTAWQKIIWKLMPFTTVGRALNSARERLNEAECDTASLDAQVILAHVLEVDRSWLFAHHDYKLTAEQADAFTDLIARRMAHEPVAYLVGKREFYGLDFHVDPRVLIPRPETELLVDAVLDYFNDSTVARVVVADVGTGSGAIALSIACNCSQAHIYAIDVSDDALAVARRNVQRLDERHQVTLAQGDLLTPLPERVHAIVANLPYISSKLYPELDADVRDFEPQLALEAGPEGLDAIHRLLRQATHFLHPNGVIFLEIGHDQGEAVTHLAQQLFPAAQTISVRKDYHGRDRLVTIVP